MRIARLFVIAVLTLASSSAVQTQQSAAAGYRFRPRPSSTCWTRRRRRTVELSPASDAMAVLERASMPSHRRTGAADAAAGGRFASTRRPTACTAAIRYRSLTIKNPGRRHRAQGDAAADSGDWLDRLLAGQRKRFAFTHTRDERDRAVGRRDARPARRSALTPAQLNNALGSPQSPSACKWVGQGALAAVRVRGANSRRRAAGARGAHRPERPGELGVPAPVRTYQDLLDPLTTRRSSTTTPPASWRWSMRRRGAADAASGGRHLPDFAAVARRPPSCSIARAKRPFSWLVPVRRLPDARSRSGIARARVKQIADLPVPTPCPTAACYPARGRGAGSPLSRRPSAWVEALDGGDPQDQRAASRQADDARRARSPPRRRRSRGREWRVGAARVDRGRAC